MEKTKDSYSHLTYQINDYTYTVPYGEVKTYHRDGTLLARQVFDRYG